MPITFAALASSSAASRMSAWSAYSPRMKMYALLAPTAWAAMQMPSISRCGFFWISSRSLKVPGSDSSALQTTYLSMSPLGRNDAFVPIAKPAPPRPRRPDAWSSASTSAGSMSSALASIS